MGLSLIDPLFNIQKEKEKSYMSSFPSSSIEEKLSAVPPHITTALLVDRQAIRDNGAFIQQKIGSSRWGAVVKADAYGLGLEGILSTLQDMGCQDYFVAHPHEGIHLKKLLSSSHADRSRLYVLAGVFPDLISVYRSYGLIPVLNDLSQIKIWHEEAQRAEESLPCMIQLDTGLARNGLGEADLTFLKENLDLLKPLKILYWMTHLARSKEGDHPYNKVQKERLEIFLKGLPVAPVSLASSASVFLGSDYHFDLARVATALFGLRPVRGQPNPMKPVVQWYGRIIQLKTLSAGDPIGYGGAHVCSRDTRIATVGVGYGDGYIRNASCSQRVGYLKGFPVPVVGRVSMDYTIFDVTDLPEYSLESGDWVELAGPHLPIDELADQLETVSYELLTQIRGRTYHLYL